MDKITFLVIVTGFHLIVHLIILFINLMKIDSENPIMFKSFYYFLLLSFNIISFIILAWIVNFYTFDIVLSYLMIIVPLFGLHFVLDEDWLLRFDKGVNLLIMIGLTVISHFVWYMIIIL